MVWVEGARYPRLDFIIHNAQVNEIADRTSSDRLLFLDGVYAEDKYGVMRFHRVKAPTIEELSSLVHQLSHRVTRVLEKKGWLQRDDEK